MPGGSEFKALKIVCDAGGEIGAQGVSRKMRMEPNYVRLLLGSLAGDDYVDLMASGKYRITAKGKNELKETGIVEAGG